MKKTARQPAGDMASNLTPPITDRPGETISYLKTKIFTRWVTGILSTVIFGCAQTLSYLHTLHLFERHGYTGWQAHLGVIMFEALFFLGAFVTTVFHFIGTQPGIPVRVATLLGASFVAWSNISYGWEFGRGGVAIGIAIILCALVAEAVVGKAILHTGKNVETSTTKVENQVEKSTHECGEVEKHSPATLEMEGVEPASMSPASSSTSRLGEVENVEMETGSGDLHTSTMGDTEKMETIPPEVEKRGGRIWRRWRLLTRRIVPPHLHMWRVERSPHPPRWRTKPLPLPRWRGWRKKTLHPPPLQPLKVWRL